MKTTYDIIRIDSKNRCGKFEISTEPSDNSLKRIHAMNTDFKKIETTVPSGMKITDIVKMIAIELFPGENSDLFTYK